MSDHFKACHRCGQTVITRADVATCDTCRKLERAPQGERVRLFEPAPEQLPGQEFFALEAEPMPSRYRWS